jgi:hypothetical protein
MKIDIGQIGAVMYKVIAGQRCDFDLFQDNPIEESRARLPQRFSLPPTDEIWLNLLLTSVGLVKSRMPVVC